MRSPSIAKELTRFAVFIIISVLLLGGFFSCQQTDGPKKKEVVETKKPYFINVAKSAGIDFIYRNGEDDVDRRFHVVYRNFANGKDKKTNEKREHLAILESLGGGVAVIDYDNDGKYDLFLPGGGTIHGNIYKVNIKGKWKRQKSEIKEIKGAPCRLYKNVGAGKFRDVTEELGLDAVAWPYTHGVAVGDFNKDSWPDLVVTGFGAVLLLQNNGGKSFSVVTEKAGVTGHFEWPTSAVFADFDGDSWPDLYICQYADWSPKNHPNCVGYISTVDNDVCPPRTFIGLRDFVFHNKMGRFQDVSKEAGLYIDPSAKKGKDGKISPETRRSYCGNGLAVLAADLNNDQKPDLYVANDTTHNFLYFNESKPGQIRFVERAQQKGVAADGSGQNNGSMGVDAADLEGKGLASLWVTNYEKELPALYQHMGNIFVHKTHPSGAGAVGSNYVGWGTMFVDMENNGSMDLIVANGHVIRYPSRNNLLQKAIILKNMGYDYFAKHKGYGFFKDVTGKNGDYFDKLHSGRGLAVVDLDNNGFPDVVISHVNQPVAVLKNVTKTKNRWLGVRLIGKDRPDVIGAKVTLAAGKRVLTRFRKGGGSYATANDPRILFGLGENKKAGKLTVYWPSGTPRIEHWDGLALNQYHAIAQGKGRP